MTQLSVTPQGLSAAEAQTRLQQYGPNALPEQPPRPLWQRFLRQFQSPLIYILLCALVVDLGIWSIAGATGLPVESLAIAVILLLNAGLGMYQESKSEAALARLQAMSTPLVWVRRDRQLVQLPSTALVPGDVMRLEAGNRVAADGALLEAEGIMVDEAVLTGESIPVEKELGGEVFSGTLVVRGKGYMAVTRTGTGSAMGRLAAMLGGMEAEQTPLERRLHIFGAQIARVILGLAMLISIGGLLLEGVARLGHVLLFAVALAVAAIPEGLPAVLTLTLALGVERMARRKAIVRRLSAVEALGAVTVIATDKTGTLTENRMYVKELDSPEPERAMWAMVLANDAEDGSTAGDPLELALLDYARLHGHEPTRLRQACPRHSSLPFDSTYKYMRTTVREGAKQVNGPSGPEGRTLGSAHSSGEREGAKCPSAHSSGEREGGKLVSYLKGAPEVLLQRSGLSEVVRRTWEEKAEAYARDGFRVLALAWCEGESEVALAFLGLALLWDPPRPEVPHALREALDAGIRVVMVTGDHPGTAMAVAHAVGLAPSRVLTGVDLETLSSEALCEAVSEVNVFARVAPEHKLRLVEALKANGEVVAMTGDGVNDAPALKRSDVGVAMGQRGSDVSREVADLVLMDDNFATIVAALEEGRSIYENIQKFIRFLFSTNLAEILLVVMGAFGSVLLGLRDATGALLLPLTAVQLLWINIITDGPPALALGLDRSPGVMQQRPRHPKAPLLDRESLRFILCTGCFTALLGGALLTLLPYAGCSLTETRTAVFLYASVGQLFYTYPARRVNVLPLFNPTLHLAVGLSAGVQMLTILLPSLRQLLGLDALSPLELAVIAVAILLTWGVAEVFTRLPCVARQRPA